MRLFWFVLGLLLLALVAGRIVVTRRRQVRTLREIARRHRLNFSSEDLIGLHERYQNLEMIRQGHSRHAWNVVYGSTRPGLIALFRYSYDMGFGTNRIGRQWWIAVVETTRHFRTWRADPVDSGRVADDVRQIGRFAIQADRERSVPELIDAGVANLFQDAPSEYHWEVRGPLVALATPIQSDPQVPEQLLTTVCELARCLDKTAETRDA